MSGRRVVVAVGAAALLFLAALGVWRWRAARATPAPGGAVSATGAAAGGGAGGEASARGGGGSGNERGRPLRLPSATVVAADGGSASAASIGGRVLSAEDGRAIAGAQLTFLHGGAALTAASDGSGRFGLATALEPGAYELTTAVAEGYAPFEPALGDSPVTLWARAGMRIEDAIIHLQPALSIVVRVSNGQGKPLADAEVRAFAEERGPGDAKVVRSDAKGEATVTAQRWDLIEARHASYKRARGTVNVIVARIRRLTLELQPGADAPLASISGRVLDAKGQPVDGAHVQAWPMKRDDLTTGGEALSDGEGRFVIGALDAPHYRLRAGARGLGSANRLDVAAGAREVELRLGPPSAGLRGHVRDGAGKPISAFTVVAWPKEGALARGPEVRAAVIDPEGRYQLQLAPGSWVVRAAAGGFAPSEERTLELGDSSADADFTLGRGGRIFGRIVERGKGNGLAGARISIEADAIGDGITLSSDSSSDADGNFNVDGVAPGRHSLAIDADGHDGRIVSGIELRADGPPAGPLTIDLRPVAPGEEPSQEMVGIAAVLNADTSGLVVKSVLPGGGAADAGLQAGDLILTIDGQPTEGLGFVGCIQLIRGPENTVVTLTIKRGSVISTMTVLRKKVTT